ncbi:Sodium/proton antiporter 1 [Asimina triloba]
MATGRKNLAVGLAPPLACISVWELAAGTYSVTFPDSAPLSYLRAETKPVPFSSQQMATALSTANQLCTYHRRRSFSSSSSSSSSGASPSSLSSANFHSVQQQRRLLRTHTSLLRFSFLPHPINVRICGTGASFVARAEEKASTPDSAPSPPPPVANEKDGLHEELMPTSGTCDPLCSLDEWSSEDFETNYQPKADLQKAVTILASVVAGAIALNHSWVAANQVVFLMVQDVAMALLFVLGSVLDNLTSTIVMVSLLRKLVPPSEYRKLLGAVVVIAANAGGAWTPIGDVTTTMLWIHGQISTLQTMKDLFVPSVVSLSVPLALMSLTSEVNGNGPESSNVLASEQMAPRGQLVFAVGFGALLFVPIFKAVTGLPPYMGILLGLGVLWILTDAIHFGESERQKLKVPQALSRIDTQGALFFLGILLSVSSLEAAGILREIANYLDAHVPNVELIASAVGVVSAIIDNVPLVAATIGMYDLTSFPQDSEFWQLVAYCAGTGGSMLIIGSAAGVAFMGMEKVDFFWYLRKVSGFALAGYTMGIVTYLAVQNLHIALPNITAQIPFSSGM